MNNNWETYLKLDTEGVRCMAQQTYEPLIGYKGTVFCKNYSYPNNYQMIEHRPLYTEEVVNWFFQNELDNIEIFKDKIYAPEIIDIDYLNKKIFLKWYGYSCNEIIYSNKNWPLEWLDKIETIMIDQYNDGFYKLTMYPHCHYIDNENNMRAIDWYGCVPVSSPFIEERYMQGIIHETAKFRLDEIGNANNGKINLEIMFKRSLGTHVMWGNYNMSNIYRKLFGENPDV
jgi:hypothetical protein